jgi:hypothetical protein
MGTQTQGKAEIWQEEKKEAKGYYASNCSCYQIIWRRENVKEAFVVGEEAGFVGWRRGMTERSG